MLGVFLNLYYYYYSLFSSLVLKDPKPTEDFINFSISEDQRLCFSWLEQNILNNSINIKKLDIVVKTAFEKDCVLHSVALSGVRS